MDPTQSTELLSRSRVRLCGDGRPRPSMPSAGSAVSACRRNNSEFALVRIPAGWFSWAATPDKTTKSRYVVWVDEFLLAAHQVTNADYTRFLCDTTSPPSPFWSDPAFNHPKQPVVGVSWHEAVQYCDWLNAHVGTDRPRLSSRAKPGSCAQ